MLGELSVDALCGDVAAEGAGDGGDVVIDHADVGAAVGARLSHGI